MINLVIGKNDGHNSAKRAAYTFFYLMEPADEGISVSFAAGDACVNVLYGIEPEGKGNVFIPRYGGRVNPKIIEGDGYTYMALEKGEGPPFLTENGNVFFTFDIIRSSFYLISCGQEYDCSLRDSFGRFLSGYSPIRGKMNIPLFDVHSALLSDAIRISDHKPRLRPKPFEIMITHDVDNIDSRNIYVFMHNVMELKRENGLSLVSKINRLCADAVRNRYLQIDNYIGIEKRMRSKSEFYFIEGRRHRLGRRYKLSALTSQIQHLKSSGHIIGMHTNFFSYDDAEQMASERERIEKQTGSEVVSSRNHYLRFDVPRTWRLLREAGILCDSTLGFPDKDGFRAGTCRAFIPYDAYNDELVDIVEVPLILMDGIIMEKRISAEEKWLEIKHMLDKLIEYGGTSSLIWHQMALHDSHYREMYQRILDYINRMGGRYILSSDAIGEANLQRGKLERLFNQIGCS